MSQENVEITRAAMADFIAGKTEFDADGALTRMTGEEHWHPDIELDVSEAVVPEMRGVFRGKEAVRRWWGEWLGAWETVEIEYELLDAGDRVVALIDQRMRGGPPGSRSPAGSTRRSAAIGTGCWCTGGFTATRPRPSQPWGCRTKGASHQSRADGRTLPWTLVRVGKPARPTYAE